MVIAANRLPEHEFASFSVFWGALFGVFGTISGIQQESTRAVRSSSRQPAESGQPGASVLGTSLMIGTALCVLGVVSAPLWAPRLLGGPWLLLAAGMGAAALAYSGHAAIAGASAGLQRWDLYSVLMSAEALARLAVIGGLALAGAGLVGLELGAASAAFVWLGVLIIWPAARRAAAAKADLPRKDFLRTNGHAMLSALSTAVLVVGFPVLLSATSTPDELSAAGGVLLAIQLTRAPIMVPLQAFQGVAIAAFVNQRARGARALAKPLLACGALGTVGAALAALLGPWLMSLLFPGRFDIGAWLLAGLTFDAALMAAVTLTGTAALALGRHRIYSTGWVAASIVALAVLLAPLPLDLRCMLALALGPAAGTAIHLVGISRNRSQGQTSYSKGHS